jgi:DNA-binding transcriptional LysR family regulator
MDIDALRAFLAVADTGSFSRAADRVFVTQPAISKRILGLEQALGAPLFDRAGRRVRLTPAGQALLGRARLIVQEVEDARRQIANLAGTVIGPLTLGTSHHVGLHRLPPALKRFSQAYPDVRLDLRFMDSEKACAAVEQGEVEIALVTLPRASPSSLALLPVWDDPLDIVVGRTHPLTRDRQVPLDALADYPAILPGPGTYTREIILSELEPVRARLHIAMSTNYLEVLKMLVSIGLGWSALPHTLIDQDLKVVHIEGVRIRRQLGIVRHAARTLSNAASAMITIVQESK